MPAPTSRSLRRSQLWPISTTCVLLTLRPWSCCSSSPTLIQVLASTTTWVSSIGRRCRRTSSSQAESRRSRRARACARFIPARRSSPRSPPCASSSETCAGGAWRTARTNSCGTGILAGAGLVKRDTLHRREYLHPSARSARWRPQCLCHTSLSTAATFQWEERIAAALFSAVAPVARTYNSARFHVLLKLGHLNQAGAATLMKPAAARHSRIRVSLISIACVALLSALPLERVASSDEKPPASLPNLAGQTQAEADAKSTGCVSCH